MNRPPDLEEGTLKFLEFHDLDPTEIGPFPMRSLPFRLDWIGTMKTIFYRSDKWEGKNHDYKHDHGSGVKLYWPNAHGQVCTPKWVLEAQTLVRLGHCLGFKFEGGNGARVEAKTARPLPELYCTPCGRALVIVSEKSHVEAVIYGGRLTVKAEGIDG